MLPSNLLIARRRKNKIRPIYAQPVQRNLEFAEFLIQTYSDHVGKTKGELNEAVDRMEEDFGYDYRFVRGLSTLLDRRCELQLKTTISPKKTRRQVFKISHKKGFSITPERRQTILRQAAKELGITMEEVEESLYGDLEDELLVNNFRTVESEALIKQYNLSLTQSLLFFSTEITFSTVGNWQRIFRQIKWLGLIYTIWKDNSRYEVKVDGPASLFKLNRRYGTSLARLLPPIVENREWSLSAKILRHRGDRRLLDLELDSKTCSGLMKPLDSPEKTELFDSDVEQDFAHRFRALHTGWEMTREPQPIPVGKGVMIPDFSFQKDGLRVYLEVVGFWTPRYLEEKVRKLNLLRNIDMIVAANMKLACHKLDQIGQKLNVIYYKRKIPLKPILTHLKTREEFLIKKQIEFLRTKSLPINEPVVEAKTLAEKLGVSEDAIKEILKERVVPGYKLLWDMLIEEAKLKEIREKLESRLNQGELTLDEATKIVEETGGRRTTNILEVLGYKVEWYGIDLHSTRIRKNKRNS